MLNFFLTWLLTACSLIITSYVVPGIDIASFPAAVMAAAILGLVNAIVRPILVLLTLPLTIMSLGLFLFVINAILLALVGYLTPSGFTVEGFLPALLGSIVLSLVSGLLSKFVKSER